MHRNIFCYSKLNQLKICLKVDVILLYVQVAFAVYSVFHQPVTPNKQDFCVKLVDTANILVPFPYSGSLEWSELSVHFHPTFSVFEPVKALVDAF